MKRIQVAVITKKRQLFEKILIKLQISNIEVFIYEELKEEKLLCSNILIIDDSFKKIEIKKIIKKIRKSDLSSNISIIIALEKNNITDLNEYLNEGAQDYLGIPFTEDEFSVRVETQINLLLAKKESKINDIQFNALLNNTPYMAWFKDKDSNYIKVNDEFKAHSGKCEEDILGKGDAYVWDGKIGDKCREYDLEVMQKRKRVMFDEMIPGKNGNRKFNVYKSPVVDELNNVIGTIGIARDITELKNKDAKLQMLMDNLPFLIWLTDVNGFYINCNKIFANYFNISINELIGKNYREFYDNKAIRDIEKRNNEVIYKRKRIKFNLKIVHKNKERDVEIYKTPVLNIFNEVIGISNVIVDVTDISEAQREIRKQAFTDDLTQIHNRRSLYSYLEKNKYYKNIGVMLFDIDNFKDINDYYGHNFGDKVIFNVASFISRVCKDAFICRLGGDEFLIVYTNFKNKNLLIQKAEEIMLEMNNSKYKGKYNISASIGIATEEKETDINTLLMRVDMAMYKAKELGKNRYTIYSKDLEKEKIFNMKMENDLNNAIENDEIQLFYQPQYTVEKELKGFEALFRWENSKYKDVEVIKVIKLIEKSNLIIDIGYYIMRKAFIFAKNINEKSEKDIVVSVNLSAIQIMDNDFIKNIKIIIKEIGVSVRNIGIEITETVLLENIEENIHKIKELKDMGITISLDDFGVGYSSLNYIVKLDLSIIKIDKSFILGMNIKEEYIKLLKLIIDAAHSLNLPVVAEGVETKEQLQKLKEMKIDYIQGYLFSKPLSEKDAIKEVFVK